MSEQLTHHPEHTHSPEQHEHHVERKEVHHHHEKAPEQPEKRPDDIENIRATIKQQAEHTKHHVAHHQQEIAGNPAMISKEFKSQALYRSLKNMRRHLSAPDRLLSRVVHQPVIDAASEVTGKTVARPSGILGGGIFALAGSLFFLYLAKHDGFHYNFLAFFAFFAGGFVLGLVLESIVWIFRHNSRV